jgi:hypothetical protein
MANGYTVYGYYVYGIWLMGIRYATANDIRYATANDIRYSTANDIRYATANDIRYAYGRYIIIIFSSPLYSFKPEKIENIWYHTATSTKQLSITTSTCATLLL